MELLHIAIKASIEAGKEIMRIYNSSDFNIELKSDNSPLTIADKQANDIINSFLIKTVYPIISEENKQTEYSLRKEWESCWIVDPLDGTKEFIKRNGEFTVNIALITDGNPVLGVIYVPVTKTLYYTAADSSQAFKCEFRNDVFSLEEIFENSSELIPISNNKSPVKIVGSRSHLNDDTRNFISEIEKENEVEIVSKGSSLKFCMVAEGEAHIYPRYAPTMEWDTAAGQAICQAAGVKVIDNSTKLPLLYNKENLLNPYFLVSK